MPRGEIMYKNTVPKLLIVVLLVVSLLTAGCAGNALTKREGGAIFGGAVGAGVGQLIGRSAEATLIGLLIGSLVGIVVGNELDKLDKQNINYAYESQPDNQSHAWQNPNNGNQFSVTPTSTFGTQSRPCRTATIDAIIDGKREKVNSTACRDRNGVWQLQ